MVSKILRLQIYFYVLFTDQTVYKIKERDRENEQEGESHKGSVIIDHIPNQHHYTVQALRRNGERKERTNHPHWLHVPCLIISTKKSLRPIEVNTFSTYSLSIGCWEFFDITLSLATFVAITKTSTRIDPFFLMCRILLRRSMPVRLQAMAMYARCRLKADEMYISNRKNWTLAGRVESVCSHWNISQSIRLFRSLSLVYAGCLALYLFTSTVVLCALHAKKYHNYKLYNRLRFEFLYLFGLFGRATRSWSWPSSIAWCLDGWSNGLGSFVNCFVSSKYLQYHKSEALSMGLWTRWGG